MLDALDAWIGGTVDSSRRRKLLGIADEPDEALAGASWIGSYVSLGSLLRRFVPSLNGRQLVATVSVPRRDYVAALIAAGWMLNTPTPKLGDPIEVFRAADQQTCLRAVTQRRIVTGLFSSLDESRNPPRVTTGGKLRPVDYYQAVAVLDGSSDNVESDVPDPGYLAKLAGASDTWLARVAAPAQELSLVGTAKWLHEDLQALIGDSLDEDGTGVPLANYVLPITDGVATWATAVVPSVRLSEGETIPSHNTAVLLDGYGAIKYLDDIEAPVVICVVDRSVADDSAAEVVVQARVANSRPVSLEHEIRWAVPAGVEALAFTVAL